MNHNLFIMEFYLTESAKKYYDTVTKVADGIADRTWEGFLPFEFFRSSLKESIKHLPVFFITSEDLKNAGEEIPCERISIDDHLDRLLTEETAKLKKARVPDREIVAFKRLMNVFYLKWGETHERVKIPSADDFHSASDRIRNDLRKYLGGEPVSDPVEMLGFYTMRQEFRKRIQAIYILTDKVISDQHFAASPVEGLMAITLQQIGYAILEMNGSPEECYFQFMGNPQFENKTSLSETQMFWHALRESLAVAFACKGLRFKDTNLDSQSCNNAMAHFSSLPMEYQLGVEFARHINDDTLSESINRWQKFNYDATQIGILPSEWLEAVRAAHWPLSDSSLRKIILRM